MNSQIVLSEKDLYCLARIIQSCEYTDNDIFHCCRYCLHQKECDEKAKSGKTYFTETVRKKLQGITGVYLGINTCNLKEKLLQNSYQATNKHESMQ